MNTWIRRSELGLLVIYLTEARKRANWGFWLFKFFNRSNFYKAIKNSFTENPQKIAYAKPLDR
jgi:hypothetical protein